MDPFEILGLGKRIRTALQAIVCNGRSATTIEHVVAHVKNTPKMDSHHVLNGGSL
jgi:hypothetical protein